MKELKHISPSKIYFYHQCPYRIYFKDEKDHNSTARFGIVLHTLYELAIKSKIKNFEEDFKREIEREENEEPKVCLEKTAKDYLVKKIKIKKFVERFSAIKLNYNDSKYSIKKYMYSESELIYDNIKGKVDLINEFCDEVEIIDFKTGYILDDNGKIKKEYEWQLKLYAFLYFKKNNKLPTKLILENMSGGRHYVDFTLVACEEIYNKAKELLHEINSAIKENDIKRLAKPIEEKCKKCYYMKICDLKY